MRYLYVNKTEAICNDSIQEGLLGRTLEEFHPEFTKDMRDAMKRKLDKEGIFSEVYKLYSPAKKAFYYAYMVIQYGYYEGRRVIITFSSDATREKEAELAMQQMAFHDPLTGLYNRYKFDEASQVQITLYARYKNEVSLVLCDIDHFKNFNDKYGHSIGDEVLKQVANIINDVVRESDTVARWGGEEFVVLLPNTSKHEAAKVAEKIRQKVETLNLKGVNNITISCGVSQLNVNETETHWFNRVDEALYEAKEAGRNRVYVK